MIAPKKTIIDDPDATSPTHPDDPMTSDQADRLRALCDEAGEEFDGALTQQQATERMRLLEEQING